MNNHYEIEQSLLGSLISCGDLTSESCSIVFKTVKTASFSVVAHKEIFKAIKEIAMAGDHLDSFILDAKLSRDGKSDMCGGLSYLIDLDQARQIPSMIHHARIIRDAAIARSASSELNSALALINEPDGRTIYEKMGEIESKIGAILDRAVSNQSKGLVHCTDICDRWTQEMEERFANPDAQKGYTSGFGTLDKILAPKLIRPKSLVVVGARPKMGKTAFLGGMVKEFSLNHKKAVALFSLEMPSDQIMERMICERANVNGNIFYEGAENNEDFAKVSAAMGEYIGSKLYMDDTPGITIAHVKSEVRKLAKREPLGLIAIDYLTLMEAEKADRNDLAYGVITKELKKLAKELDCVVLLLTQLNRSLESRPNKRPMPSDSRDTGQIEQDCDLWIGLYREAVYNDECKPEEKGLTEAIVRLNRHGDTGTAHMNMKNGYFIECAPFTISSQVQDDNY